MSKNNQAGTDPNGIVDEIKEEQTEQSNGEESTIDADFADFVNNASTHDFPNNEETTNQNDTTNSSQNTSFSMVDDFKLKMFTGLLFLLLDGVHGFLFSFISKYDVKAKDIAFDDSDKEAVQIYFNTPRVMEFINNIPSEMIGIMHIEYLYYQKFSEAKEEKKLKRKKFKTVEVDDDDDDKEEEKKEEKPTAKKAPAKRKPKRKAPAKKSAK